MIVIPVDNLLCFADQVEYGFVDTTKKGPKIVKFIPLGFIGFGIDLIGEYWDGADKSHIMLRYAFDIQPAPLILVQRPPNAS